MLQRYLEELGEKQGRYVRYIPQPSDDEESDGVPLGVAAGFASANDLAGQQPE
jgi:hypothetical protein